VSDYERGLKEGRVDALLEEHAKHLNAINGSIERFIIMGGNWTDALRTMQEEARADRLEVKVTADTLAKETERRRIELSDAEDTSIRRFTLREKVIGWVISVVLAVAALYFK